MRTFLSRSTALLALTYLPAPASADPYLFEAVYTGDVLSNVSGGLDTGTRYLDNIDLILEVDVEEAWRGVGTMFIYGLYNNGTTFADELVGDLQVNSNIDAPGGWRIFELWYEAGKGPWSVRGGLYDLNSEFDVSETGALFLSSSHGIGPALSQTGENGPSLFPVSSLALRASVQTGGFTTRVAVLDAVPGNPDDLSSNRIDLDGDEGALLIAELDTSVAQGGRLWAGIWRYTAEFEPLLGRGASNDNDGWYIGVEREFNLRNRSAAAFLRYGAANEQLNPIATYVGAGIVVTGIFAARPDDQLGLSVAYARIGDPWRAVLEQSGEGVKSHETQWELTYRARINEHLVLQPDIQLVQNPSASHALDDAWVAGLRLELSY